MRSAPLWCVLLLSACTPESPDTAPPVEEDPSGPGVRVLILVPDNYGANFHLTRHLLELEGFEVTLAASSDSAGPCPSYAARLGCTAIQPDLLLGEIDDISTWDALVVTSGSRWAHQDPIYDLLASQEAVDLVTDAHDAGLVVSGWCSGLRLLAAAGVLEGVRVTGNKADQTLAEEAGAIWAGEGLPPVLDGQILTTARGNTQRVINVEGLARAVRLGREESP